jgi:hypothetical protein
VEEYRGRASPSAHRKTSSRARGTTRSNCGIQMSPAPSEPSANTRNASTAQVGLFSLFILLSLALVSWPSCTHALTQMHTQMHTLTHMHTPGSL